jgi:small nuclear ribonucleoprotein (snRNP)-like protein
MEYPPPGTALVEELDRKLLVQLRDNRKIIGVLRSFDQFANLVLEDAVERIIVGSQYCDVPLGIYVLRGENLVLMGQVRCAGRGGGVACRVVFGGGGGGGGGAAAGGGWGGGP